MALSTENVYEKELKSQFCKFIYKLATRLVDVVEKREQSYNSSPELNNIAQAVVTIMYIYRVRYRLLYSTLHNSIINRKKFFEFCVNFYSHENLPYFFTFLLNISLKFEMFLYLREEGYNYFAVFAYSLANYTNYSDFESRGGEKTLVGTAQFFLERTRDLELLVGTEYPCRKKLLSLEAQISEIETKYFELSEEDSFALIQAISRDLYRGLQNYSNTDVLPFIILRFFLDGRVPECPVAKVRPAVEGIDSEDTIIKYFNRCLVPEIVSGEAYTGRDNFQTETTLQTEPTVDVYEISKDQTSLKINVCKEGRKRKQNTKAKELNSNLSDNENSSLETEHSSGEKTDAEALVRNKHFDAKENKFKQNKKAKVFNSNLSDSGKSSVESEHSSGGKISSKAIDGIKEKEKKKKEKELNSNLSDSDISPETEHSSGDKTDDEAFECIKHFDALLLNSSPEDSSSGNTSIPFTQSAAGIPSAKLNLSVMQKETFSNYISSEEENNNMPVKKFSSEVNNSLNKSKKRNRRKRKKKIKKVQKADSDNLLSLLPEICPLGKFQSITHMREEDPVEKWKDHFMMVLHHMKRLHCWEKKFIFFLLHKTEAFSVKEKITVCERIQLAKVILPEDEENIIKMLDLLELEEKCDLLYSENKDENENFLGKLPFPGCDEHIREDFSELLICILALSCDNIIQASVLGDWMPVLHEVIEKNEFLMCLLVTCRLNGLFHLLIKHASM